MSKQTDKRFIREWELRLEAEEIRKKGHMEEIQGLTRETERIEKLIGVERERIALIQESIDEAKRIIKEHS